MSRRAKTRAEHDDAVARIQWFNARAAQMIAEGDDASARRLAEATTALANLFWPPEERAEDDAQR